MSTDKDWEKWGSNNPYFGVLSDPRFLGSKIRTDNLQREFYESGKNDIAWVVNRLAGLRGSKKFTHAVDFGCGVGRLTIPLAEYAANVTGLDVSPSVLQQAEQNTPKGLQKNITYAVSNDALAQLPKHYDFVHSYIVLQHIPPKRGNKLIKKLVDGLAVGGCIALHVTFAHNAPPHKKMVIKARNNFIPLHYILNIMKGNPLTMPRMRMHLYDLNSVIQLLGEAGITETVQLLTDHGGYIGVMILGRKV